MLVLTALLACRANLVWPDVTATTWLPAPGAERIGVARIHILDEGPAPGPGDEVVLVRRDYARQGANVVQRDTRFEGHLGEAEPLVQHVVRRIGTGGAARVWPDPGTEALFDIEVISVRPAAGREALAVLDPPPSGQTPALIKAFGDVWRVVLVSEAGVRYPASTHAAHVPPGIYEVRADFGLGEGFAGVTRADPGSHGSIACAAAECWCAPMGTLPSMRPYPTLEPRCEPRPDPPRPDPGSVTVDGPWPLVDPAALAELEAGEVRCRVVDPPGPDGLGYLLHRIEGCGEPWRSAADAWAYARPAEAPLAEEARIVVLSWSLADLPDAMRGEPWEEGTRVGSFAPDGLAERAVLPHNHAQVHPEHDRMPRPYRLGLDCRVRVQVDAAGTGVGGVVHGCPTGMARAALDEILARARWAPGEPFVAVFGLRWPTSSFGGRLVPEPPDPVAAPAPLPDGAARGVLHPGPWPTRDRDWRLGGEPHTICTVVEDLQDGTFSVDDCEEPFAAAARLWADRRAPWPSGAGAREVHHQLIWQARGVPPEISDSWRGIEVFKAPSAPARPMPTSIPTPVELAVLDFVPFECRVDVELTEDGLPKRATYSECPRAVRRFLDGWIGSGVRVPARFGVRFEPGASEGRIVE